MKLLGIDVGTTGVKAAIFSQEGEMLGCGMETYAVDFDGKGHAEQDGELVWRKAVRAVQAAAAQAGGDVDAVSVSAQGDALLLVGRSGQLLAPVQLGMDYRAAAQTERLCAHWGESALYRRTGMPPHPLYFFLKLLWTAENCPALLEKTWKAMTYADFFLYRLCGAAKIDATMAGRTMAVRLSTGDWDDVFLSEAGVSREKLSEICPPGTAVGVVRADTARMLGISEKALVAAGGHDQVCAALGAGVSRPRIGLDSHGTAEVLSTALSAPCLTEALRMAGCPCYPHGVEGRYFTFGLNHTGGVGLQRYRALFGYADYEAMLVSLPPEPTALLTVPSFLADARGACAGTVTGLRLSTAREEICKSFLEGLAFEMRRFLELFSAAGAPVHELRCVGGGARSAVGLQLKADVYGRPVATLHVREAACLGAAILAGTAAGAFASVEEGIARMVRTARVYAPDPVRAALYREKYGAYVRLLEGLRQDRWTVHV